MYSELTTLFLACLLNINGVQATDMTRTQPAFLNQYINGGNQHCCAGVLDIDAQNGQPYCCIGNNNAVATNTATSFETNRSGTMATCSTTIHVTEKDYTSKVEAVGTKYGVSYVETTVNGARSTGIVAVTPTSTGAAVAAMTPGLMVGEALIALGAVALGL